jgi:hypothetical protein
MLIVYAFQAGFSLSEDFEVEGELRIGGKATVSLLNYCFLFGDIAFGVLYFECAI